MVVVILMVISSGIVLFPPLVEIREHPEFMILWRWIRHLGLGAFFGMVGYPISLASMVVLLGLKPLLKALLIFLNVLLGGILLVSFLRVADDPDVWTDGSLVDDKISGVSSAGGRVLYSSGSSALGFLELGSLG